MNVQEKHSTLRDFTIMQELGKGSFSTVYKVRRIKDSQEYALKKVKLQQLKQKERENALNEVRLLASINDNYIVAYKEAFLDNDSLCIVMELLPGGDVSKRISQAIKGGPGFTEADIWRALIHITKGLKTLHDQKIVHRDLKSANIFVGNDGTFKLGDLNVSKVAKQGLVYTQTGTPFYASPEVWRDESYDVKSDIWSLGCVIYEMANLRTPFRGQDMEQLYKKVQKGFYDPLLPKFSRDLADIVMLMLQQKPSQRPSCEQILKHPAVIRNSRELSLHYDDSDNSQPQLLQTIQIPRNVDQLRSVLPKSKYDLNDKSTENSTSPFRSKQVTERISQSQVLTNSQLRANSSSVAKHQLLLEKPKETIKSNKLERPQSYNPRYQHQEQRRVSPKIQEKIERRSIPKQYEPVPQQINGRRIQSAMPEYSQENNRSSRLPALQGRVLITQSQQLPKDKAISPKQSYSPMNRTPEIKNSSSILQNNPRYNNPIVRPTISQSISNQQMMSNNRYQSELIVQARQHPQSAVVRQQNHKYSREEVFPTQAKVQRPNILRTQPNENHQRDLQPRPAGKPSRPISSNLYQKNTPTAQYNLITNNYNHYYPIDNYQLKPDLLKLQMKQELNYASRPLRQYQNQKRY